MRASANEFTSAIHGLARVRRSIGYMKMGLTPGDATAREMTDSVATAATLIGGAGPQQASVLARLVERARRGLVPSQEVCRDMDAQVTGFSETLSTLCGEQMGADDEDGACNGEPNAAGYHERQR